MNFLNPLFLFGLIAAAIPIVIHLFTRKRPREVQFSSLEFLSEVNRSEIRRIQIKQWLLLLLRTLAVIALALAMARPVRESGWGARQGAATTAVVLVDRSGSMESRTRSGTLIEEARRTLESLLSTLGPGDDMLLVPYDEGPQALSARPLSDLARLRAATQALAASARRTEHSLALAYAARALGEIRSLNRELFWISDFQASGFATTEADDPAPASFTLPPGPWEQVRSYLIPLAPPTRPNAALIEAAPAPAGQDAALTVTGRGLEATAGDLAVQVRELPGAAELGRGFIPLPAQGDASTLIPLARLPDPGGEAVIPDDALALDNRRVFAAGRSGTLRVLLREDGPASPLRIALEAGSPASGLTIEVAEPGTLPARIGDADAVVLNDLERLGPTELQGVLDYLRGGGSLLLVMGRSADSTFWSPLLAEIGAGRLAGLEPAAAGGGWRLRRRVPGHAVLAGFPARPGEVLSTARFQTVRSFTPAAGARVLLEFDRSHPALVEAGRCLVFLAPLDIQASDFPVSGAFLPLFHQVARVMGRGTAAPSLLPGERYGAPAGTGSWRIEDEAGREVGLELVTANGATRLTSAVLERPGLYRVLQSGQLRASFAVNPDPRESDLRSFTEAALLRAFPAGRATLLRPGADLGRRVRESRYGLELWPWFVALALALLVAETLLGRWGMRGLESLPPAPAP